jgi:hypothetical protein
LFDGLEAIVEYPESIIEYPKSVIEYPVPIVEYPEVIVEYSEPVPTIGTELVRVVGNESRGGI